MGPTNDDFTWQLFKALLELIRQHAQAQAKASEPSPYVDFSRQQIDRENGTVPLSRNLAVEMFQQLCRTKLSVARFLLLPRAKAAVAKRGHRQSLSAFRHELTILRRTLKQFDLPLIVERHGKWIRVPSSSAVRTNVTEAKALAREAVSRLEPGDLAGASRLAEAALRKDIDCAAAARVVVRIFRTNERHLNLDTVSRARVCLARGILRYVAATRRLQKCTSSADAARARGIAQRIAVRLDEQWQDLLCWPFDASCFATADAERERLFCEFVELWVRAFREEALAYRRLAEHQVISGVVDRLLDKRVKQHSCKKHNDLKQELTLEILEQLMVNVWSPVPTSSLRELQDQLISFLARKIDWHTLLRRGGGSNAEWRDNLSETNDVADDDPVTDADSSEDED